MFRLFKRPEAPARRRLKEVSAEDVAAAVGLATPRRPSDSRSSRPKIIQVPCPICGLVMRVRHSDAGNRGRCPRCKMVVEAPAP